MSFKIGDFVSVIDEDIKGYITKITLIKITLKTNDGFERDYDSLELTKIKDFAHQINTDHRISKEKTKQNITSNHTLIVDLHLDKIPNADRIEPGKELSAQLAYAKDKIEEAITKNIKEIIFIHGIGKSILGNEIYALVRRNYNAKCSDAPYKKYGKGATKVTLL